jgi:hypothetical protein
MNVCRRHGRARGRGGLTDQAQWRAASGTRSPEQAFEEARVITSLFGGRLIEIAASSLVELQLEIRSGLFSSELESHAVLALVEGFPRCPTPLQALPC